MNLPSSERNSAKAVRAKARRNAASELSRHLIRAEEEERKRISAELHDGTGQGLMVLRLYLGMLASENQAPESQAKVQEAMRLLDQTIEDLRCIIGRLSPRVMEELGLLAAVRKAARDFSRSTGIKATLDLPRELPAMDREAEVALYRSLQEALHNIAKHARAKSLSVRLQYKAEAISLSVQDDGVGFSGAVQTSRQAFGLWGMEERAAALGGKLRVQSKKGSGTQVKVTLPLFTDEQKTGTDGSRTESLPSVARAFGAAN